MKIAVDATFLTQNDNAGPENYVKNLVESMFAIDTTNEYIIYTTEDNVLSIPENPTTTQRIKVEKMDKGLLATQIKMAKKVLTDSPDVLFSPFHKAPLAALFSKIKVILMIHGIEYESNGISPFKKLIPELQLKILARSACAIVVPSTYVKEKLLLLFNLKPEKISVIPEGVSKLFFEGNLAENSDEVLLKHSIVNDFFLAVSTIQPRKNYNRLILAFSNLCEDPTFLYTLVICGKYGWGSEETLLLPEKLGIKNRVIFTGRVDDSDLLVLYKRCSLSVNVSLEEGFGLPLLESMASRKKVVISNLKPFKDLALDNAIYVNPHDATSITEGLKQALLNYEPLYIQNAYEIAKTMSWERTAREVLKIISNC